MSAVDDDFSTAGSFERYIEHVPAAFAVTRGRDHLLVYANAAFRKLVSSKGTLEPGSRIADAFGAADARGLTALLDRAFRTGAVSRDRRVEPVDSTSLLFSCTVWPDVSQGGAAEHLVLELRVATHSELTVGLQREVAGRLLLSALQAHDAADASENARRRASFLAVERRRLAESLDERATLTAMAGLQLPHIGAWCIVDILDEDGKMFRLAILHPDPAKQALLDELHGRWIPEAGDGFGLSLALQSAELPVVQNPGDVALTSGPHSAEILRVLSEIGVGPLLTVPLVIRGRMMGAITFVGEKDGRPFASQDIALADDLASSSAMALDRARLYGASVALTARAEAASQAKTAFLGMVSHELRTPLNAIGGYVDLMDLELHGPVTEAQHVDLARIRSNQRYLTGLISDMLNFAKVSRSQMAYDVVDMPAHKVLADSVALVEPLIAQRGLTYELAACDPPLVARGDREKVIQILVNLLSNAIKFTPAGGQITLDCRAANEAVLFRVSDTGIGIPADQLESIFDPFVQVRGGIKGPEAGIGLGLAISRTLARAMHGDLTVATVLGQGAEFTLSLPRAH